jgi:hypothetical protein
MALEAEYTFHLRGGELFSTRATSLEQAIEELYKARKTRDYVFCDRRILRPF